MDLNPTVIRLIPNFVERFLRGFRFQEAETSTERLIVTKKFVTKYIRSESL